MVSARPEKVARPWPETLYSHLAWRLRKIMKRILILGCPASGKSTLARRIAQLTGLPLVHLDRLYWRPGWVEAPQTEFCVQLAAELARDTWIIDGNYRSTLALRLESADTAIFLDFPRWPCLGRAMRRSVFGFDRQRPDTADGCREKLDPEFLGFIWRFRREYRPRLLAALDGFPAEKILLRSPAEVGRFLSALHNAKH